MPHLTGSIQLTWDVLQKASGARVLSWNVQQRLTNTRVLLWNINQHLTGSRQLLWSVNQGTGEGEGQTVIPTCRSYPTVDQAFSQIYVDHLILGNTKIYWELNRRLFDPGPYVYQLQVGHTGLNNADDWQNVGSPVNDTHYALDDTRRLYGKQLETNYRIVLTTGAATYYSQPIPVWGKLSKRDWLLAREITRKELLRLTRYTATDGYLLIRKRSGTICPVCTDPLTGEITKSNDTTCYGTGYTGGYYAPLSCTFFDLSPDGRKEERDLNARGMVDDTTKKGRFIGYPLIRSLDVFVDKSSDERYYVDSVQELAELRGVPIVVAPVLKLIPFSEIVYNISVPN
jgi:hypothetical protein